MSSTTTLKHHWCAQSSCSNVGIWADQLCCGQPQIQCRKRLLHQAHQAWCTRTKKRQKFCQLCDTGMQSARLGDSVVPSAGAMACKANHTWIEGEHWAPCACLRRGKEQHTLTDCQSWGHRTIESGSSVVYNLVSIIRDPLESQDGHIHCILLIHLYSGM